MDTILLVDDDPLVLRSLSLQLEAEGFQVAQAASGRFAVERLASGRFDLVLTDLVMEEPDGLELLEHTKRLAPDTAVIILTGYGDVRSAIEALRLGADDFLLKPCDPDELIFRIKSSIERRGLRASNHELEQRVAERAEELERLNRGLEEEVAMHKATEEALSRSLEEKEVLLREIQHRVKNNLATISGLINLQGSASPRKSVEEVIANLKKRVRAIQLIYERLYNGQDLTQIDYREYVESLSKAMSRFLPDSTRHAAIEVDIDRVQLDVDLSIPLGLVISELLSNALTHAFPGDRRGVVTVRLVRTAEELLLTVADNGIGMDEGRVAEGGLGIRLVGSLAEQMGGSVAISGTNGTVVEVRVPLASG